MQGKPKAKDHGGLCIRAAYQLIFGLAAVPVCGRAILEAVAAGESEAAFLAGLARGRLREKRAELERALAGEVKPTTGCSSLSTWSTLAT